MSVTRTPQKSQSASRPRTWLRRIIGGGQIVERCAAWCTADHAHDVHSNLDDLTHRSDLTAVDLLVEALIAQVRVDPYSENPRRHIPYATFEATDGFMLDELGPEELAAIIAKIRAHCDALDGVLALLIQARAEYGVGA
jgi:hypothetical protein